MATLVIQPDEATAVDCSISSGANANTAYNDGTLLAGSFHLTGPGVLYRSLLRMSLASLPVGAVISAARLDFAVAGGSFTAPITLNCRRVLTDFTEAATWNNPWDTLGGDFTLVNGDTVEYTSGGVVSFVTLATLLRECVTLGATTLDLEISEESELLGVNQYLALFSSAAVDPANRPKLTITYTEPVSQHNGLLVGVHAELVDLAGSTLPGISAVNIVERLVPAAKDIGSGEGKTYGLPALLLFPGANERFTPAMNQSNDIGYPIVVAVIEGQTNATLGLTENKDRYLYWREVIINHFINQYFTISSPACVFHECLVEPGPIIDWAKWGAEGLRVGSFTLRFFTRKLNRQS